MMESWNWSEAELGAANYGVIYCIGYYSIPTFHFFHLTQVRPKIYHKVSSMIKTIGSFCYFCENYPLMITIEQIKELVKREDALRRHL